MYKYHGSYGSIKIRVPDSAANKDVCFTPFDNLRKIQELVSFKMTIPFLIQSTNNASHSKISTLSKCGKLQNNC